MEMEYKVKEFEKFIYIDGQKFSDKAYAIGFKKEQSDIIFPSPLTNYIKTFKSRHPRANRKSKSLNTQRSKAYALVNFLNYCLERVMTGDELFFPIKEKGIYGLDLVHGASYITFQTSKVNKKEINIDTFNRKESELIDIYLWLQAQKIINIPELDEYLYSETTVSPFNDLELDVVYPSRELVHIPNKIVDFGENRISHAFKFIQIAEIVCPEIALGVCFQFFGGLRRGEVVNLTRNDFIFPNFYEDIQKNKSYILHIQDNQKLLFPKKSNYTHEQVKTVRKQSVMPFQIVNNVFARHKKQLKLMEENKKIKNRSAIFVDYNSGKPINGLQYYRRFMKIKDIFMKQLSFEQHKDFNFLNEHQWSTHIGRGIFTNILLEKGADIVAVFTARGDKNPSTIIKYVEEKKALKFTQEVLNEMESALKESHKVNATIDMNNFDWKEV
ncbi:hypothetical protein ACKXGF_11800 [Alkalibacillus sp. S2W]|uniref:hypothetical protein n=1 Tax=Alkalibacillus sp. S2W TaxID=3386553 RepID=UPI00398C8321